MAPARALAAVAIALAGCTQPAPQSPTPGAPVATTTIPAPRQAPVEVSRWACGDAATLVMVRAAFLAEPDRVEIAFDDGAPATLGAAMSGAGALYEGDGVSFQTIEDRALLTRGTASFVCRRARPANEAGE